MTARLTEQQGWEIAEAYSTVDAELGAARNAVAMADATRNGKLTVEGTRAQDLLSTTFDLRVIPINAGIVVSGVGVYRLRNDLFFVSTVPGEEESIQRRLEATALQSGDFVHDYRYHAR